MHPKMWHLILVLFIGYLIGIFFPEPGLMLKQKTGL